MTSSDVRMIAFPDLFSRILCLRFPLRSEAAILSIKRRLSRIVGGGERGTKAWSCWQHKVDCPVLDVVQSSAIHRVRVISFLRRIQASAPSTRGGGWGGEGASSPLLRQQFAPEGKLPLEPLTACLSLVFPKEFVRCLGPDRILFGALLPFPGA